MYVLQNLYYIYIVLYKICIFTRMPKIFNENSRNTFASQCVRSNASAPHWIGGTCFRSFLIAIRPTEEAIIVNRFGRSNDVRHGFLSRTTGTLFYFSGRRIGQ